MIPKPEPLDRVRARRKRQRFLARRRCRALVYEREQMICQRCGKLTKLPSEVSWEGDPDMAHIHEPDGRGQVDYTNPDACQLWCGGCHMPNGVHVGRVRA